MYSFMDWDYASSWMLQINEQPNQCQVQQDCDCVAPKYINYFQFITQLEYTKITFQLVFIFNKNKNMRRKNNQILKHLKIYKSLRFMPYNAIYGCSYL